MEIGDEVPVALVILCYCCYIHTDMRKHSLYPTIPRSAQLNRMLNITLKRETAQYVCLTK